MRRLAALGCVVALLVALPGVPAWAGSAQGIRLALVVTPPGKGDLSWNFMAWLGAERAKELGYVREYTEIVSTEATALSDIALAAESGRYDLIVSAGWEFMDPLREVANRYPHLHYVSLDDRPVFEPGDRGDAATLGVLFQQEQPSALAGALAALLAVHYDAPHVGVVLGREGAVLYEFEMGYKWGVNWAIDWLRARHPELLAGKRLAATPARQRVLWTYTGTWSDPAQGRQATEIQVQQGAAVVYAVAGATGLGVLSYVEDFHRVQNVPAGRPPFAIGVDSDQDWINSHIIASAMKRVDVGVLEAARLVYEGRFRDMAARQKVLWLNLANRGVWLSDEATLEEFTRYAVRMGGLEADRVAGILTAYRQLRAQQPQWVWQAVEELKQAIIDGRVIIPRPFGEPERWPIERLRQELG